MKVPTCLVLILVSLVTVADAGVTLLNGSQQIGYGGGFKLGDIETEFGPYLNPDPNPQGPTGAFLAGGRTISSPDEAGSVTADMSLTSGFEEDRWYVNLGSLVRGNWIGDSSSATSQVFGGAKSTYSVDFSVSDPTCMTATWNATLSSQSAVELDELSLGLSLSRDGQVQWSGGSGEGSEKYMLEAGYLYTLEMASTQGLFVSPAYLSLFQQIDFSMDIRFGHCDPSTIPAPGALLLAGLGSGLVGYMRRRKSI